MAERLNLIANYFLEYSKLPKDEKKGNDPDLKEIVDKYDRLNTKSKKNSKSMWSLYKKKDTDESDIKKFKTKSIISFFRKHTDWHRFYNMSATPPTNIQYDIFELKEDCEDKPDDYDEYESDFEEEGEEPSPKNIDIKSSSININRYNDASPSRFTNTSSMISTK